MPHQTTVTPDILRAFQRHPELADICGQVEHALAQKGLSNRVYRLDTENGPFFLRLPRAETAGMVDRYAEAVNIEVAAELGIALPALFCDPQSGILLTSGVETLRFVPDNFPAMLGKAVGGLHGSSRVFAGQLDADAVFNAQKMTLMSGFPHEADVMLLEQMLKDLRLIEEEEPEPKPVPSHGDLSPGNCLAVGKRLWLIDWEYSAMSLPAWDLAYASVEHGFSREEEAEFLEAYREFSLAEFFPTARQLEIMKARCDAVSSLWAFEQLRLGSGKTDFLSFAHARRDRALERAKTIIR